MPPQLVSTLFSTRYLPTYSYLLVRGRVTTDHLALSNTAPCFACWQRFACWQCFAVRASCIALAANIPVRSKKYHHHHPGSPCYDYSPPWLYEYSYINFTSKVGDNIWGWLRGMEKRRDLGQHHDRPWGTSQAMLKGWLLLACHASSNHERRSGGYRTAMASNLHPPGPVLIVEIDCVSRIAHHQRPYARGARADAGSSGNATPAMLEMEGRGQTAASMGLPPRPPRTPSNPISAHS